MSDGVSLGVSFVTLSGAGFVDPPRFTFEDRVVAAKQAGFDSIGVRLSELMVEEDALQAAVDGIQRHDMSVTEVEFLAGWAQNRGADEALALVPTIRQMSDAWGGFHVTSGEFGGGLLDASRAAANLRVVADALSDTPVTIAVEAFAWSAISDYEVARRLILDAGAENVGLMLDIWHFVNTGGTPALLEDIGPEMIAAVQLNDGPRVTSDFMAQARATRWLPGDGDLGVSEVVDVLRRMGFDGHYMVEVSYPELLAMPLEETAILSAEAARRALECE